MRNLGILAAGVLVGAAALAGGRALKASPEEGAPTVAVVDVDRVLQAHPGAKRIVDELTKKFEDLKTDINKRDAENRKKREELGLQLDPGTAEYEKARKALELIQAEIQYDSKAGQDAISRQQAKALGSAYKEICAAVEVVARAKGITCVLSRDMSPVGMGESGQLLGPTEQKLQLALRTVVWAKPELDITKDVIEALGK